MNLSDNDLLRYSRQIVIQEIGKPGQEKISSAKVGIVGLGGLGCIVSSYLAGAGIGSLSLADFGPLEISNLHRQVIYNSNDDGKLKTEQLKKHLNELNSNCKIVTKEKRLNENDMSEFFCNCDIVADCSDNFVTRAAVNKACHRLKKTYVYAAVYQFEGQIAVFDSSSGACLECLYPDIGNYQDTKSVIDGVFGPAVGAIASIQSCEILKLILGLNSLKNQMLNVDILNMRFNIMNLKKNINCPVCGK